MSGNVSTDSVGMTGEARNEPKSSDLITRIESAERGSRELDAELMALTYVWDRRHIGATCWDDKDDTCCPGAKHLDWVWVDPLTDQWKTTAREGFEFTTSIDAALTLAERVLPGWWPAVSMIGPAKWVADIYDPTDMTWLKPAHARTPALALVSAILKAKEQA